MFVQNLKYLASVDNNKQRPEARTMRYAAFQTTLNQSTGFLTRGLRLTQCAHPRVLSPLKQNASARPATDMLVLFGITLHSVCLPSSSLFAVASSFLLVVLTPFRRRTVYFATSSEMFIFWALSTLSPLMPDKTDPERKVPFFHNWNMSFLTGVQPFHLSFRSR